jgi:hypothetical protein
MVWVSLLGISMRGDDNLLLRFFGAVDLETAMIMYVREGDVQVRG